MQHHDHPAIMPIYMRFLKENDTGAHNYIGLYCLTLCIIMILQFSTFYQNYIEKESH